MLGNNINQPTIQPTINQLNVRVYPGFSKNGIDWTWSSTPPYTRWVNHTGSAKAVSYGTMERPFLLTEDFGHGPVPTA
eukprot:COSAG05_NODE_1208_length_5523_cov_14.095686_5_plen_78_part_00